MAKGKKTGGRKKGSGNLTKQAALRFATTTGALSEQRIIEILTGKMPCSVCRGEGKTLYQPSRTVRLIDGIRTYVMNENDEGEARLKPRTCLSCYGSGLEQLSPELVAKVAMEERQYVLPKLKQVEHTNPDGSLRPSWTVILKDARNPD